MRHKNQDGLEELVEKLEGAERIPLKQLNERAKAMVDDLVIKRNEARALAHTLNDQLETLVKTLAQQLEVPDGWVYQAPTGSFVPPNPEPPGGT